ncbi:hypothetical protein [Schaalia vaccimaxillae]|uniref:hypothetical protein n=1 Tax=Schaalia vaccimaxillae TaxID=183916 RepID=UPI00040ED3B9|nr:hypothetical protein [Schaalia vaccimaxillae]
MLVGDDLVRAFQAADDMSARASNLMSQASRAASLAKGASVALAGIGFAVGVVASIFTDGFADSLFENGSDLGTAIRAGGDSLAEFGESVGDLGEAVWDHLF